MRLKWLPLLLLGLSVQAGDPQFWLDGIAARERKGVEFTCIIPSDRDMFNFPLILSAANIDPRKDRKHETRVAIGTGGGGENTLVIFDLVGTAGGPWSSRVGLRVRATWSPIPYMHVGYYAVRFFGQGDKTEAGFMLGVQFPR